VDQQGIEIARAFLETVGDEPVHLPVEKLAAEAEIATFNWLRESTAGSSDTEFPGFIIRRLSADSANSYVLRLHRRKGYPELVAGTRYVHVHCLRNVSDPEIHGIIDVDEMKVVSIIEDGGA
jgi:hypothetical protein